MFVFISLYCPYVTRLHSGIIVSIWVNEFGLASYVVMELKPCFLSISTTLIVLIFARTNFRAEHRFARNCAEISITDFLKLVAGARKS